MGKDGHGTPPAEMLTWDLGDLEDHFIQPTCITDRETEKQRSSYQLISGQSRIRIQAPGPSSDCFLLPVISPNGAATQKVISACPLVGSHLVSPVGPQAGLVPHLSWYLRSGRQAPSPSLPSASKCLVPWANPWGPACAMFARTREPLCVGQVGRQRLGMPEAFFWSLPGPATGEWVPGLPPQGGGWLGRRRGLLLAGATVASCAVSVPLA